MYYESTTLCDWVCLLVNTVQGCGDLCLAALAACLRLFAITRPNALFAK